MVQWQTLRRLERNGMVERRVLPTSPVGVQYSLTVLGESLREPFGHLYDWTVANATEIQARRRDHDRRVQRCDIAATFTTPRLATARPGGPRVQGTFEPMIRPAVDR